jgi:hypothetical protein
MTYNPYQSPIGDSSGDYQSENRVNGPAMALIIVTSISLVILVLSLLFDVFLLTSGVADQLRQPAGMSKHQQVVIRMIWGILIIAVNGIILYGAMQMKSLRDLGMARTACYLSLIPCCGPCFVLGIPFGIWGLMVLNDPQVQRTFKG